MDLTPKQQTSEAIRQAETILITSGQHPSVDQVAAVLALSAILRKFGKKVSAIISDPLPPGAQFMDTVGLDKGLSGMRDFILKLDVTKSEVDKLRYEVEDGKLNVYITPFKGGFAPSDVTFGYGEFHYDLAIVLGVPTRARIDRVYGENQGLFGSIPVVNIDFHRTNESYGAVNLIEPTASSLCEILVATSESLQTGLIDADIATVMLAGLMASTDRFTASHTTSKSLTVAAQMMAAGARQQAVVKGLYRDGRGERDRNDRPPRPQTEQRPNSGGQQAPASRPQQPAQQAQPATQPMRPMQQQASVQEERPQPVQPTLTEQVELDNEPLIMPDHIEMSRPEEAPTDLVTDEAPENVVPMADFAAAAEILRAQPEQIEDNRA